MWMTSVIGNDNDEIQRLKRMLAKEFEIKDLGKLRYILGIEVARSKKGIFLSQRNYVLDLLKQTEMLGCKLGETPIDPKHNLESTVERAAVDKARY